MPLLIDCYNVLHCAMPPMLAGLDVERLCRVLATTRWAKTGDITVVADGRPNPLGTPTSPTPDVALVYSHGSSSGGGQTADDVIIARIAACPSPKRLTVVSSDREIRTAARQRRCTSWRSEDFLSRLCGQLRRKAQHVATSKPRPQDAKRHGVGRTVMDGIPADQALYWLREMGVTDVTDPAFHQLAKTPPIQPESLGIDLHLEDALAHLADTDMNELMRRFGKT
ncbi:MAG: NYN domain-containing protein [Planctomycetota bacterium]